MVVVGIDRNLDVRAASLISLTDGGLIEQPLRCHHEIEALVIVSDLVEEQVGIIVIDVRWIREPIGIGRILMDVRNSLLQNTTVKGQQCEW